MRGQKAKKPAMCMGGCAKTANSCGFWKLSTCVVYCRGIATEKKKKNADLLRGLGIGGGKASCGGQGGDSCMWYYEQPQCVWWQQSRRQLRSCGTFLKCWEAFLKTIQFISLDRYVLHKWDERKRTYKIWSPLKFSPKTYFKMLMQ